MCAEEGCEARSTSVDHIVSLAEGGGPYDRSNVRGMCYEHHKRRSSRQGAETRKRNRQRKKEPGQTIPEMPPERMVLPRGRRAEGHGWPNCHVTGKR